MWACEYSVRAKNISAEQVWQIYSDVAGWSTWDKELISSTLSGKFEVGSMIKIKPKRGPKVRALITECIKNEKFTDITKLPINTKVVFLHLIKPGNGFITLTHRVEIDG